MKTWNYSLYEKILDNLVEHIENDTIIEEIDKIPEFPVKEISVYNDLVILKDSSIYLANSYFLALKKRGIK